MAGYTGSKEDFAPLLAPLADAGYRVVALDQRGQFESPGPDDPAAYSVPELGLDVVAVARVLREESGEPLHLLGHSFGGLVTRAAVLAEPALFTSFTLLGSGPSRLGGRPGRPAGPPGTAARRGRRGAGPARRSRPWR